MLKVYTGLLVNAGEGLNSIQGVDRFWIEEQALTEAARDELFEGVPCFLNHAPPERRHDPGRILLGHWHMSRWDDPLFGIVATLITDSDMPLEHRALSFDARVLARNGRISKFLHVYSVDVVVTSGCKHAGILKQL